MGSMAKSHITMMKAPMTGVAKIASARPGG